MAEALRPTLHIGTQYEEPMSFPSPSRPRVLVVDDYRDGADGMVLLLRALGAEARAEYDGTAALESLAQFQPDLVLLDLGLPGLDGFEVARLIRNRPGFEHVRLVAVSGSGDDENRRRTTAAGFDGHLEKPLDPVVLKVLLDGPSA